ncbi:MAG: hypothetical protein ACRDSH_21805 [Pseudonocardiaceae bacterium]
MTIKHTAKRPRWLSQWFSVIVAIAASVAWLVVDNYILHTDKGATAKLVSAGSSAVGAGLITLLFQLYSRLGYSLEMLSKLGASVDEFHSLQERLLPNLYVSPGMKTFHGALLEWRDQIGNVYGSLSSPLENAAWLSLVDAYFKGEHERVQSKTFRTTSDQYTGLVSEISQILMDSFTRRREAYQIPPLLRVHITAMLPEEFYNGPQIEYTRADSQPLFFCHRLEDYPVLYGRQYRRDPRTQIRRYIVVRDPQLSRPRLSALSTFVDLQEQACLVIGGSAVRSLSNDIDKEPQEVLARLMRKSSARQLNDGINDREHLQDLIRSIHGFDRYGYWPIAESGVKENCSDGGSWQSLLEFFARDYHSDSPTDALYCVLNEEAWAICEGDEQLSACFAAGWTPEIALFATQGARSAGEPFWHFGILGLWRPFTRDMQLRFLTGADAARLHNAVIRTYNRCRQKGDLLSLTTSTEHA